jgi:2-polyprenyl-3-methyl-5-hydroxy-6-metoxy-1,4-benzoquinol methylase
MNWGASGVKELRARLFAGMPTDWQRYHKLIADRLAPGTAILDVGCGKGVLSPFPWQDYPDKHLVGIDPDPAASQNPHLDRLVLLRDRRDYQDWPLGGETFDLVTGRYVVEHIDSPSEFLGNVRRALKPGGQFVFLTPNLLHPAMVISRLLPHSTKERILGATRKELDTGDIFPTRYRMNTSHALRFLAHKNGLRIKQLDVREHQPVGYLDFSVATFWLAYTYYRTMKWSQLERWFGSSIIGILERT